MDIQYVYQTDISYPAVMTLCNLWEEITPTLCHKWKVKLIDRGTGQFNTLIGSAAKDLLGLFIDIDVEVTLFTDLKRGCFITEGSHYGKKNQTETVLKTESAEPSRHMLDILSYCSFSPFLCSYCCSGFHSLLKVTQKTWQDDKVFKKNT